MPKPNDRGPAVARYEIQPGGGVKVSKIVNSDDIALALAAKMFISKPFQETCCKGLKFQIAKQEILYRLIVWFNQSSISKTFRRTIRKRDISGNVRLCDITMPHMLIAGSTSSGKSVCINGIITKYFNRAKPHEVKLMMIDRRWVELVCIMAFSIY